MSEAGKQLSNPFSTGGGGPYFEACVQASFAALMLTGGFAPGLSCLPIVKMKLQGKFAGYETDDLIVFTEDRGRKQKLIGQIKHTIKITKGDATFREVIQAAWTDFNNPAVCTKGQDVIALITGPLSATDTSNVRRLLEWARESENADEFFRKVELANFSSEEKRKKLAAFRTHLNKANQGQEVADDKVFSFLRHFHLLGYDLDIRAGVTLSFLHSLIGQYSPEDASQLWSQIVNEVQMSSMNAGFITRDKMPYELRSAFEHKISKEIPSELVPVIQSPSLSDWNAHPYAADLVFANLIGAWSESYDADQAVVQSLVGEDYQSWLGKLREFLQAKPSPVVMRRGEWRVAKRKELWQALRGRLFEQELEQLGSCVVSVLSENDPQFELPPGERYLASIHEKVLTHSGNIRKGLAESLALLGNQSAALPHCSHDGPGVIALLAVRDLLDDADWVRWASLNHLLPVLAEAAPSEFLRIVEKALGKSPCPFDELFAQEDAGIGGSNYLTGLLWALETLAWEEEYLLLVCAILGELASRDPGGKWQNRPTESLRTILLPWFPQTLAAPDKRKAAFVAIRREFPEITWRVLLHLLPTPHQSSSETHKPSWRNTAPIDRDRPVPQQEYWEQVSFYCDQAVSMAGENMEMVAELVEHIESLQEPFLKRFLEHLTSTDLVSKSEEERFPIWNKLLKLASKHRMYADAKWAFDSDTISEIEDAARELAPTDLMNRHRVLFCGNDADFFEEKGNWDEQQEELEKRRQEALQEILAQGGMGAIFEFSKNVELPEVVGRALGPIGSKETDTFILPALLGDEDKKCSLLAEGYVWNRGHARGAQWLDELNRDKWSPQQAGLFLSLLPFTEEAWGNAAEWLGESDSEYWSRARVNPYQSKGNCEYAVNKLVQHGRPYAAIDCLCAMQHKNLPLDSSLCVSSLMAAASSSEPAHSMNVHHAVQLIKHLQDNASIDPAVLSRLEWACLPILRKHHGATPKLLWERLAANPDFFCEVLRRAYRSTKDDNVPKEPTEEQKAIATNAGTLLHDWETPPGTQTDGSFSGEQFQTWLISVKEQCRESGHLEVALEQIGEVLIHCPLEPDGLWINEAAATALNEQDSEGMRRGFQIALFNSRGAHRINPSGVEEKKLAEECRQQADDADKFAYQRLAATMRDMATSYEHEAQRVRDEHANYFIEEPDS